MTGHTFIQFLVYLVCPVLIKSQHSLAGVFREVTVNCQMRHRRSWRDGVYMWWSYSPIFQESDTPIGWREWPHEGIDGGRCRRRVVHGRCSSFNDRVSSICELSDVVECVSISVLIWSHNKNIGLRGCNVSGTPVYKRCNWWIVALKNFLNGATSGLPVIVYEFRNSWPEVLP